MKRQKALSKGRDSSPLFKDALYKGGDTTPLLKAALYKSRDSTSLLEIATLFQPASSMPHATKLITVPSPSPCHFPQE